MILILFLGSKNKKIKGSKKCCFQTRDLWGQCCDPNLTKCFEKKKQCFCTEMMNWQEEATESEKWWKCGESSLFCFSSIFPKLKQVSLFVSFEKLVKNKLNLMTKFPVFKRESPELKIEQKYSIFYWLKLPKYSVKIAKICKTLLKILNSCQNWATNISFLS